MSSESKKKRGLSGQAKARTSPFRLNGLPVDWYARKVGAYSVGPAHSGGSTLMRGLLGGVIVAHLGYGKIFGDYERKISHAQTRVSNPLLRD